MPDIVKNKTTRLKKRNLQKDFFWTPEVEKEIVEALAIFKENRPLYENVTTITKRKDGKDRAKPKIIKKDPYFSSYEHQKKYNSSFEIIYKYSELFVQHFLRLSRRTNGFEDYFDEIALLMIADLFETGVFYKYDPERLGADGKPTTFRKFLNRCCENATSNVLGKNDTPHLTKKYNGGVLRTVSDNRHFGPVYSVFDFDENTEPHSEAYELDRIIDGKWAEYDYLYECVERLVTVGDDYKDEILKPIIREWYFDQTKAETNHYMIALIKRERWDAKAILTEYTDYPVTNKEIFMLDFALKELKETLNNEYKVI
jgi:hypothetical protein